MLVIRDSNCHELSVGDISQLTMTMADRLQNKLVEIGRCSGSAFIIYHFKYYLIHKDDNTL
jgi:hypothetical protein